MSWNSLHPDQFWQVSQVSYDFVYGGVQLPWEFDPEYRLRNIIYPAVLSVPLFILKWLHLDYNILVVL